MPTKNRGSKEKAHADRCIASAVSWLIYSAGLNHDQVDTGKSTDENPVYGSFLWRERQELLRVNADGPEFGLLDVVNF